MSTATVKATRRPGPWQPIEPPVEPARIFYTDALCTDTPKSIHLQKLQGISKWNLLTPRQRIRVRRSTQ